MRRGRDSSRGAILSIERLPVYQGYSVAESAETFKLFRSKAVEQVF